LTHALPPGAYPRASVMVRQAALGGALLLTSAGCHWGDIAATRAAAADYGPPGIHTYEEGTRLFLDRVEDGHRVRIGLEQKWGGSIVEVSLDQTNFVNAFDAGREVQLALYDGSNRYDGCAGCDGVWGWNPVQAGDRHSNGSVVLEKRLEPDAVYIRVRPNHWYPDDKGGGNGRPVPTDVVIEQRVSTVPGHPRAFRLNYRVTHLGTDTHAFTAQQEFPAIYVNRHYDRFVHYDGARPWTDDRITSSSLPRLFVEESRRVYVAEWWGAFVDDQNVGLTIFTPGSFPYMTSGIQPGSAGPNGTGAVYTHPYTPFGIQPGEVIEGDIYLIAGGVEESRGTIYDLVRSTPVQDVAAPIGAIAGMAGPLKGVIDLTGWAYDNAAVSEVQILVDGVAAGRATLGQFNSEVRKSWPGASSTSGFVYRLDTTRFPDGTHTLSARLTDAAGNLNEVRAVGEFRNAAR
jgi:hypothetical protein